MRQASSPTWKGPFNVQFNDDSRKASFPDNRSPMYPNSTRPPLKKGRRVSGTTGARVGGVSRKFELEVYVLDRRGLRVTDPLQPEKDLLILTLKSGEKLRRNNKRLCGSTAVLDIDAELENRFLHIGQPVPADLALYGSTDASQTPLQVALAAGELGDHDQEAFLAWCNGPGLTARRSSGPGEEPTPNRPNDLNADGGGDAAETKAGAEGHPAEAGPRPLGAAAGKLPPITEIHSENQETASHVPGPGPRTGGDVGTFSASTEGFGLAEDDPPIGDHVQPPSSNVPALGLNLEKLALYNRIAPPLAHLVFGSAPASIQNLLDWGYLTPQNPHPDRPVHGDAQGDEGPLVFHLNVMYDEQRSHVLQYMPSFSAIAPTCARPGGCTDEVPVHVKVEWRDLTSIDITDSTFDADVEINLSWLIRFPGGAAALERRLAEDEGRQGQIWHPQWVCRNRVETRGSGVATQLRISDRQLNARHKLLDSNVIESFWPGWKGARALELKRLVSEGRVVPMPSPGMQSLQSFHSLQSGAGAVVSTLPTPTTPAPPTAQLYEASESSHSLGRPQSYARNTPGGVKAHEPAARKKKQSIADPEVVEMELNIVFNNCRFQAKTNLEAFPFDDLECGVELEFAEPFGVYQAHIARLAEQNERSRNTGSGSQDGQSSSRQTSSNLSGLAGKLQRERLGYEGIFEHVPLQNMSSKSPSEESKANPPERTSGSGDEWMYPVPDGVDAVSPDPTDGTGRVDKSKPKGTERPSPTLEIPVRDGEENGVEMKAATDATTNLEGGLKGLVDVALRDDEDLEDDDDDDDVTLVNDANEVDGDDDEDDDDDDHRTEQDVADADNTGSALESRHTSDFMEATDSERALRASEHPDITWGDMPYLWYRQLLTGLLSLRAACIMTRKNCIRCCRAALRIACRPCIACSRYCKCKACRRRAVTPTSAPSPSTHDDFLGSPSGEPPVTAQGSSGSSRWGKLATKVTAVKAWSTAATSSLPEMEAEELLKDEEAALIEQARVALGYADSDRISRPKIRPCIDFIPIPGRMRLLVDHSHRSGRPHGVRPFRWGVEDDYDRDSAVLRVRTGPTPIQDLNSNLAKPELNLSVIIRRKRTLFLNSIVPIYLFQLLSLTSILVDYQSFHDRASITLTLLLTVAATSLPGPVKDLWFCESLMMRSTGFIFLVTFKDAFCHVMKNGFNFEIYPDDDGDDDSPPDDDEYLARYAALVEMEFALVWLLFLYWALGIVSVLLKFRKTRFLTGERLGFELFDSRARAIPAQRRRYDFLKDRCAAFSHMQWRRSYIESELKKGFNPPRARWKDKENFSKPKNASQLPEYGLEAEGYVNINQPLSRLPVVALKESANAAIDAFGIAKSLPQLSTIVQGAHAHEAYLVRSPWVRDTDPWLARSFSLLPRHEQLKDLRIVNLVCSFVALSEFIHSTVENVFNADRDDLVRSEEFQNQGVIAKIWHRSNRVPLRSGDIVVYLDPTTGRKAIGVVKSWMLDHSLKRQVGGRWSEIFRGTVYNLLRLNHPDMTGWLGESPQNSAHAKTVLVPEMYVQWDGVSCLDFELSMLFRTEWLFGNEGENLIVQGTQIACRRRKQLSDVDRDLKALEAQFHNPLDSDGTQRLAVPSGMLRDA